MKLNKHMLSLAVLACGVSPILAGGEARKDTAKEAKKEVKNDDKAKQKAIAAFIAAAALTGAAAKLGDTRVMQRINDAANLRENELAGVLGLSATLFGASIFAEKYADTLKSFAWRAPLMALLGGALTHDKFQNGLALLPFGVGNFVKDYHAKDNPGVHALEAIALWFLFKPALDRVENYVSKKATDCANHLGL